MTERQRIEKAYEKVRAKFPDITDKSELDKLVIKEDKKNLLLKAIALFGGAVLCIIVNILLSKLRPKFSETSALVFIAMLSAFYEMTRTLIKYFKAGNAYKPVVADEDREFIDVDTIMEDCGSMMHNLSEFSVIKEKLYDKEDELDVLINNATSHDYYLYFIQDNKKYTLEVKKAAFDEAVIGSEYYVVLTKDKREEDRLAIFAYPTLKYALSDDVKPFCEFNYNAI